MHKRGNLTWIKWEIAIKLSASEAHSVLSYSGTGDHRKAGIATAAQTITSIQGDRLKEVRKGGIYSCFSFTRM